MVKINIKKIAFAAAGLTMLASPLIASAQTATASTSANASLIAILTQLVQTLEQELQQPIAAHQNTTPAQSTTTNNSASLTAIPASDAAPITLTATGGNSSPSSTANQTIIIATPSHGQAPLSVTFTFSSGQRALGDLAFGDGSFVFNPAQYCTSQGCTVTHTYETPGTYTITLTGDDGCGGSASCNASALITLASTTVEVQ